MRTKTLLLTAALCAAGVASSMAQVYSINTVGYVNVVIKGNGAFSLVSNPLDDGTNTLTSLLNNLPNKSGAQIWTGSGFTPYAKALGAWNGNPPIPVGTGFFVSSPPSPSPDITNTFVGTVVPNPGSSTTNNLPPGFSLVGSRFPVSGDLLASGAGTLNLGPSLPNKSSIQIWNNVPTPGQFVPSAKALGSWSVNFTINPGQGFFVNLGTNVASWPQTYP